MSMPTSPLHVSRAIEFHFDRNANGLAALHKAYSAANITVSPPSHFALELSQLLVLGMDFTDLRALIKVGLVEHWQQAPQRRKPRQLQKVAHLDFSTTSCFMLTEFGNSMVTGRLIRKKQTGSKEVDRTIPQLPKWDTTYRRLVWSDLIVKQFYKPAPNQVCILGEFEKQGWPNRIDSPLPNDRFIAPKTRLDNAIKSLNEGHMFRAVRFGGDGTGCGISWHQTFS